VAWVEASDLEGEDPEAPKCRQAWDAIHAAHGEKERLGRERATMAEKERL
jgi:hypothetical protein